MEVTFNLTHKAFKTKNLPFPMKKSGVIPIFLILIFLMCILPVSAYSLKDFFNDIGLGALVGYDTVYKQNWGSIICVEGALEPPYIRYLDDQSSFTCNQYTDECRITITKTMNQPLFGYGDVSYKICDAGILNSNCGSSIGLTQSLNSPVVVLLPYNKKIVFEKQSFFKDSRGYYQFSEQHRNFYIRGQENGKIYVQESCILNSDLKKRVLSDGLNELQRSGANQFQNYMIDFISVATKTYSYSGSEVICQARQLYSVDSMQFKDGATRKVQGYMLKAVECCPSEPNCDENSFKFSSSVTRDCYYDSECPNGGSPIADTGTSYIRYSCLSGSCVQSSPVSVECTNNAVCVAKYGTNSVCDLSPSNFGKCKDNSQFVGYCGDGKCESLIGETADSCPADCGPYKIKTPFWKNPWFWAVIIILLIIAGTKFAGLW